LTEMFNMLIVPIGTKMQFSFQDLGPIMLT
jgi:hypothetical protein